ncbi:MAG TPA: UDP-4-amino-4,6-dideoxy-N-acetyl-beta-L-altrosamine transaminase [Vicinamibacterales bacterium]|nr:UDP-4-amino-4,6-dideoxy-N-acetyl-beta-L-altrosamine transaminase [Vicinamibacterales bacterium]
MTSNPRRDTPLAIHGGPPVRKALLPYGRQTLTEADVAAATEVLRSDWLTTGPKVAEFEEAIADYVDARHAVSFSSGTAALHAAVLAAGLKPGDEAITTPLTFCATANAALYGGGTPVFADVRDETLTIDPKEVERRITPRTKALLPVDYAGQPADLDALLALADRHELLVIEDAAHALGAKYRSRMVGSISHMSVFSFHAVKHLTTGEGGMVTTNNSDFAQRLREVRNHGIDSDARARQAAGHWHYEMTTLGFNYRLTDIACALGLAQLPRLSANLARRRAIAVRYGKALATVPSLTLPIVAADVTSAWHLYPVRVDASIDRAEVFNALRAEGLGVNVHYIPVHLHPYYRSRFGYRGGEFPIAETASGRLISLPMFHGMTDEDVDDVIFAVEKVMNYF